MSSDDIQGKVTDASGNAVANALVALWSQGSPNNVITTQADSNGNYIFNGHPDGDSTSQNWHIAARDPNDGSQQFPSLHSVSASLPSIPDSRMFQSPVYQFWGGEGIGVSDGETATSWVDALSDITASAVGDPIYNADQSGFEAVKYDGSGDAHDFSSDSQVSLGSSDTYSVFVLFYLPDTNNPYAQLGIDTSATYVTSGGAYAWNSSDATGMSGGSVSVGSWDTIGFVYDGGSQSLYGGGGSTAVASQSASLSLNNDWSIGRRPADNVWYNNGYVAEVIVSSAAESGQAYADYHADRLG